MDNLIIDVLPKELVYIIIEYLDNKDCENLSNSNENMLKYYNNYKSDILSGAICPFQKIIANKVICYRRDYSPTHNLYYINNESNNFDHKIKPNKLSSLFKEQNVNLDDIKFIYFIYIYNLTYSVHDVLFIYEDISGIICIKVNGTKKGIFKGNNWFQFWSKLTTEDKAHILRYKYKIDYFKYGR